MQTTLSTMFGALRTFIATHCTRNVRLGCTECDCDDKDGITEAALARCES
jgi:hypothetical protein